jgi:hypothetical protein
VSRLRKTVVPFHWSAITANFQEGTAASVNLATYLANPQQKTIAYSASGSLPTGVTLTGSTLSYNGVGQASLTSVQFVANSSTHTAESASTQIRISATVVVPVNTAPVWTAPTIALGEVSTANVAVYASDVDGPQALTFGRTGGSADTAPGGVTVSSTGALVIPAGLPAGTYTVQVYAEDGYGLVGLVTGFTAASSQYNRVVLAWTDVEAETSYQIQRSTDGTTWTALTTTAANVVTYTDTTTAGSTTYYYRIRGANAAGVGAYATATVITPAESASERLEFADIPEIVFLEGFAENEELGIYILDPLNRTRPGDHTHLVSLSSRLRRHDAEGGGNYAPRSGVTLTGVSGTQPPGVSYNAATGQLSYTGAAQTDSRARWTVKLAYGAKEAQFDVRVMRPQVVYGTDAAAVNTLKGWGATVATTPTEINAATTATTTENVIAILGGTYTDANWLGSADREKCYILGEPYNKPFWVSTASADAMGYGGCQVGYIKNIKSTNTQLKYSATDAQVLSAFGVRYTVYNCELVDWTTPSANAMEVSDYGGSQDTYCVGPYKFHCVNVFTRKGGGGSGGTKHLMYIHGRPNGYLNVINAKFYGVKACSQIKTVMKHNFILNSYLHNLTIAAAASDGTYPAPTAADLVATSSRAQSMINTHAFCHTVVYNNDMTVAYHPTYGGSQVGAIHVQYRGYQFIGGDEPMAPDHSFWHYTRNATALPTALLNSCSYGLEQIADENWPLGGTPAYPLLTEAAPELGGWPNTADTYMDPDFWDDIRGWNGAASVDAALVDPTNPFTYKRYISHNRFTYLDEGQVKQPWLRDDGFIAGGQYSSTFSYVGVIHPTTANWTQRGANFSLNNTWTGWTDADVIYRLEGRGQKWEDVEISMYASALAEANATRTQLYGPFGTITRDSNGLYASSTGDTITVNGKSVPVGVTPTAEAARARTVVHVGGGSGPTAVTDPDGTAIVPSWFKIGATG